MNPLIPERGICDPHIHIFQNRAWLYATCDERVPGAAHFRMVKWQIWSSEDLVHWHLEGTQDPAKLYCGPIDQCWAVDAAEKDGTYYWYYSVGAQAVGVGKSAAPGGPFLEARNGPLVGPDTPPVGMCKWDPCVFVDDDGAAYLIVGSCFGTDEYQIARLGEDMISLAEPLRTIPYFGNPTREDKASIHKENGLYYLTHASFYATSENIYGPYVHRGNTGANIDHGSFFTYRGQTYQAAGGMDNPNRYYRASFLSYCHYRKSGEIVVEQLPTAYGVGQYDASWQRIETRWFSETRDFCKQEQPDGSFSMEAIKEGGWLAFPNVCHMAANMAFTLSYTNPGPAAWLEIRQDNPQGPLLGRSLLEAETGDGIAHCSLSNAAGHSDLYLCCARPGVRLHWFALGDDKGRCSGEAFRGRLLGQAAAVDCPGAAADRAVRLAKPGDGVALILDGCGGGAVSCFLRYEAAGETSLRLQMNGASQVLPLPGGPALQEIAFELTMAPGINRLCLLLDGQAPVLVDSLRTEAPRSWQRSYSAADGQILPWGNGCWDGLAQPEWDRDAFQGRCVTHLEQPGYRVVLDHVDGGPVGGEAGLLIRYGSGGARDVQCRLEVNGGDGGCLCFPPTGGVNLEHAGTVGTTVQLRPGQNRLALTLLTPADPGLCVDAFSIAGTPET